MKKDLTLENLKETFASIVTSEEFNSNVQMFMRELYPLPYRSFRPSSHLSELYGACFLVGYKIRQAEESFASSSTVDPDLWTHDKLTEYELEKNQSSYEKIKNIALEMEERNDTLTLGDRITTYSYVGTKLTNDFYCLTLANFLKAKENTLHEFNIDNPSKEFYETLTRNICLGYCFKVSEEIVSHYGQPQLLLG